MSLGVLFVWKVYEKVHGFINFGGCAAILCINYANESSSLLQTYST